MASNRLRLRSQLTCPHCWESFATEDTHWVSEHPDLLGDPRLGDSEQRRFLPSRFTVDGNAIDACGLACEELACPNCHLVIPRSMLELAPFFVSIIGAPACGKTYFLASMVWRLRDELPKRYCLSFVDADPKSNRVLNEYEEAQFFNKNRDELVKLAKTEEYGHLYNTVNFGGRNVTYPMPFLFAIRPTPNHPSHDKTARVAKLLCLYDNAGESFQPGKDSGQYQVTRHLSTSDALMFLYDPTQEPRFRQACEGFSHDPQMTEGLVTSRQEVVFHELTDRVRRLAGLTQSQQHERPLYIVVTKADTWSQLLEFELPRYPAVSNQRGSWWALDMDILLEISKKTRSLLARYSHELVSAAESFAKEVHYIPVSALGTSPERDSSSGSLGVRPRCVEPTWVEVPLLWMLSKNCPGLVPYKHVTAQ